MAKTSESSQTSTGGVAYPVCIRTLTGFWLVCQREAVGVPWRRCGRARPGSAPILDTHRPVRGRFVRIITFAVTFVTAAFEYFFYFFKNAFCPGLGEKGSPGRGAGVWGLVWRGVRHPTWEVVRGEGCPVPGWCGPSPLNPTPQIARSGDPPSPLLITLFIFAPGSMGRLDVIYTRTGGLCSG